MDKLTINHCICMVSDFFYPSIGGVETHIWSLSQCLIMRGHKVIVVTHSYDDRQGVRYMSKGLKVYYLPLGVIYDQVIYPTMFGFFGLFRNILIREGVTVVHGHQSTSTLTNECILYARALGYKTCYTDHSMFGFNEISNAAICVSHACRENLVLRGNMDALTVYTIPNAVNSSQFTPDPSLRYPYKTINIVMLSRLVFRKGIELAVKVIPEVCRECPNVYFIIGGDGPLRPLLDDMVEEYHLHGRVELLGSVAHSDVRDVLCRGHIFFNCSLTESFCMALLEATSCGLFVVSTRVGGVPEVLPMTMMKLAEPSVNMLVEALIDAIPLAKCVIPMEFHNRIKGMYNWNDVASRTEVVYNAMLELENPSYFERMRRRLLSGSFSGLLMGFLITFLHFLSLFWEYWQPAADVEECQDITKMFIR